MRFSSKTFRRRRANKKRNVRKTKKQKKTQAGGTLLPYSSSVPAHAAKPITQRLDESKIVDNTQGYFQQDDSTSV
jgi:hypothetical protein